MKEVRNGLFIGDLTAASKALSTSDKQITHVLSLISSNALTTYGKPLQLKDVDAVRLRESLLSCVRGIKLELTGHDFKVIRMWVPWNDTEDENILDGLEACLEFIDHGRQEGTVLVHCLAGISRRYYYLLFANLCLYFMWKLSKICRKRFENYHAKFIALRIRSSALRNYCNGTLFPLQIACKYC